MRYHITVKFLAVFLCTLALLSIFGCGGSLLTLADIGINDSYTVDDAYQAEVQGYCNLAAISIAKRYASAALGSCSQDLLDAYFGSNPYGSSLRPNRVYYTVSDRHGNLLESTVPEGAVCTQYPVTVPSTQYMHLLGQDSQVYSVTVPSTRSIAEPEEGSTFRTFDEKGNSSVYHYTRKQSPTYIVTLYLADNAVVSDQMWTLLRWVWNLRSWMIALLGISILVFAICAVFLCLVAGRSADTLTVRPGGLNRIPIDLYGFGAMSGIAIILAILVEGGSRLLSRDAQIAMACVLYGGYIACLLFVGFCYCFAAQIKTPGRYMLKNSLCGRLYFFIVRTVRRIWRLLPRSMHGLWRLTRRIFKAGLIFLKWLNLQLMRPVRRAGAAAHRLLLLLPLTWQWLLVAFGMAVIILVPLALNWMLGFIAAVLLCIAIVLYGAWSFGTLLDSAQRMRSGDLESKIDDKLMVGGYREFTHELNALADVAMVAAQKQLQSERMKTELITNVSHDIKTPLTSIINYVDLLEKPHTPEEEKQYLEVLNRQSRRMKKLIEDLIELSKAASGAMNVELISMDAAEAVNQALGEFADKLESAELTPVFHAPKESLTIRADGRLMWRAMSNVLSNAVKYALPGTRLYVELIRTDSTAWISLKNISREQLNIPAEELLERFVRGDISRNTEGSGLGLNIAKSLMELQGGDLKLLVDGDLFKVTLVFPLTDV